MAVITVSDVFSRPFSGYEDARYPSGFWRASAFSTGDGTGGDHTLQFDFNKATSDFNSQFYSLESIMVAMPVASDFIMDMLIANFDRTQGVTNRDYNLNLFGNERTVAALSADGLEGLKGLFLGQQTDRNSAQSISLTVDNGDGEIITALLEGYIWGVRSMAVSGGPQRPPTGLYR